MSDSFYLMHYPCEHGRGNHYYGPFGSVTAAEEHAETMPRPEHWHVVPAGDTDVLGTVGVDC